MQGQVAPLVRPGCPSCNVPLSGLVTGANRCPVCAKHFEAAVFQPPRVVASVRRLAEAGPSEAASCAIHEMNAAVAACERCGTFACDLCRIVDEGRTLCPACFDRKGTDPELGTPATRERNYSFIASLCLLGGFLGCAYFGLLLGPAAIYFAVKGKRQAVALGRSPGAWWLQVALGVLEALGQLAMFGFLIWAMLQERGAGGATGAAP